MMSAILCAVTRNCCGVTVNCIDTSVDCLTTSDSTKRTSTRPSGSGCIDPTTTASALRERHTAGWISSARTGRGTTPFVSTSLNMPERARSAPTIPEIPSGHVPSLPNGTIAIGIAAPAPPTISIDS